MNFSDEAKREIEKNLGEVVRNINVDDREREEIVKELRSTYYEAAEGEARARGADVVTAADASAAKASISAPRETADSFMKSYAGILKRAGFWSRLIAFVIDNIAIGVLVFLVTLPIFSVMLALGLPLWDESSWQMWSGTMGLRDSVILTIIIAFSGLSAMIIFFGYYILLEGHFGYTAGKYLMSLRVLRTDGTKIGYKEALLRNLSKYINNLIVIDTLIMLIFFYKEKQRGFDRIANTMVVHMRVK